MRSRAILVALLVVASAAHPGMSRLRAQDTNTERVVTERVRAYFAAMGGGKVAVIEQSLAPDYLVIGGDGKVETRAERLAWLRGNAKNLLALTPREIRVRAYGATAVATGLVVIPQDAKTPPIEERFTQVWVQRQGVWQMVSGQITIVRK